MKFIKLRFSLQFFRSPWFLKLLKLNYHILQQSIHCHYIFTSHFLCILNLKLLLSNNLYLKIIPFYFSKIQDVPHQYLPPLIFLYFHIISNLFYHYFDHDQTLSKHSSRLHLSAIDESCFQKRKYTISNPPPKLIITMQDLQQLKVSLFFQEQNFYQLLKF